MTISLEVFEKSYTTQGLVGEAFPTTFTFDKPADLFVYLDTVKQILGTNYSVTGGNNAVGTVTWVGTPTAAKTLLILGRGPATQTHNYQENDPFPAKSHEDNLDRLARMGQAALRRDATDPRTFDASADRIINLAAPAAATDAVNKAYADGLSAPSITIPTPANPGDDDEVLTALAGAYITELPPFKKTDLPLVGEIGKFLKAIGIGVMGWDDPPAGGGGSSGTTRNFLINGDFQVNQRKGAGSTYDATSPHNNADGNYTLDRWKVLYEVAGDGVDVTHEQGIPPLTVDGATGAIKLEVVTGGAPNNKFGICQYLTNLQSKQLLSSGATTKVSLSFKARTTTGAAIANLRVGIAPWTSGADTPPADPVTAWNVAGANPTLNAGFTGPIGGFENTPANIAISVDSYGSVADLDVTMTIAADNVMVFIWVDDVVNAVGDLLYISDIQLEIGSTATAYARHSFPEELNLCQFFYQKTYSQAVATGTSTEIGSLRSNSHLLNFSDSLVLSAQFQSVMRIAPAITLYSTTGVIGTFRGLLDLNNRPVAAVAIGDAGFSIRNTGAAIVLDSPHAGHYIAEAEL